MSLVDAVDKNEVRNAELVEDPEGRGGEGRACRVGVDHDNGDVRYRHTARSIGRKPNRTGRVNDGVFLAEVAEIVEVGFGRSASGARFLAAVTDARLVGNRTLSVSCAAGE